MPDLQEKENGWLLENSVPNARPAVRPTHPSSTTTMTLLSTPVNVRRYAMQLMPLRRARGTNVARLVHPDHHVADPEAQAAVRSLGCLLNPRPAVATPPCRVLEAVRNPSILASLRNRARAIVQPDQPASGERAD